MFLLVSNILMSKLLNNTNKIASTEQAEYYYTLHLSFWLLFTFYYERTGKLKLFVMKLLFQWNSYEFSHSKDEIDVKLKEYCIPRPFTSPFTKRKFSSVVSRSLHGADNVPFNWPRPTSRLTLHIIFPCPECPSSFEL